MKTIKLPCFDIVVQIDEEHPGRGNIISSLHEKKDKYKKSDYYEYEAAIDAIESLIFAHACAGIDIESPAYLEGIEIAIIAISNNLL